MLCYDGKAYKLNNKNEYFTKWVREKNITYCGCIDLSIISDNPLLGPPLLLSTILVESVSSTFGLPEHLLGAIRNDEELLKALTSAVRYLNEVELSKRPGNCDGTGVSGATTCTGTGSTCTYVVHTYKGQKVKVSVTCEPVTPGSGEGSPESSDSGCYYKKMIHTHNGIGGAGASGEGGAPGFRLGSVKYGENQGQVHYTTTGPNRWNPLVRVTTYFYSEDKNYNSPLLVVLEFHKNGAQQTNTVKEYYKLNESGGGRLNWTKDDSAASQIGDGDNAKVVKYLDQHRYSIKKVIQIEIQNHSGSYQLKGGKGTEDLSRYTKLNGVKKVVVTECEKCEKLTRHNYKCFKHDITGKDSGLNMNEIGGLKFTVPGQNGQGIEIPLYGHDGTKMETIPYNKCMGDVFVYFYNGSTGVDKVPLMLFFNGKWYKPESRDEYFTKWVTVSELVTVTIPCGNGQLEQLATQLDIVNRELNRIELTNPKVGKADTGIGGNGYGLPESLVGITVDKKKFNTQRVALTRQHGPKQPQPAYVKIVHRTVNGFQIGDIKYNGHDFGTQGIKINGPGGGGAGEIEVKKNGSERNGDKDHKNLVKTHSWNTVVAYYSISDSQKRLPQLIVILKTNEVSGDTVKASEPGYGYYILSSKTGSGAANGYEYVWFNVPEQKVTLNDATDFSILNSVVLLIEQRPNSGGTSYNEEKISKAITSAGLRSPGRLNGEINRITGKDITLKDETSGSEGKCLNDTGFKLITHDISALVTVTGSLGGKLGKTTLIAGLRFLIPTCAGGEYKRIKLYDQPSNGGTKFFNVIKYHQSGNNNICVYFYEKDPRPLMLCYNGSLYKPRSMSSYFYWWVKDTSINTCVCKKGSCECKGTESDCCKLLESLVRVSNFLNRVDIGTVPRTNSSLCFYQVHEFNGKLIRIKVELEPATTSFCYNKYTHTHVGTGNCRKDGAGFRLGTIDYGCRCIKDNNGDKCITSVLDNGDKYTSASEVVVFYYQGDNKFERPLLVALCKNNYESCDLYYELQKADGKDKGAKLYKKGKDTPIDLSGKAGSGLEKTLDRILFKISKTLQIIIDKFIPPSYKAKLFEPNSSPAKNGSTTTQTSIQVTPVKSWQLTKYGYRCYMHNVQGIEGVEQIGGLRFYLWDNTKGCGFRYVLPSIYIPLSSISKIPLLQPINS